MKALIVVAGVNTYGGDRVIGRYGREMRQLGWDVEILSIGRVTDSRFYSGLPIKTLGIENFPSGRTDYFRALRSVRRSALTCDVALATWTPTVPIAWAIRLLGMARRVAWLQQDYPAMFEGLGFETFILRHGARIANVTVAVSQACATFAGAPRATIQVLHSGLEECFFDPCPRRVVGPVPSVIFVGEPSDRKGWPDLVTAAEKLRKSGVRFGLVLVARREVTTALPTDTRVVVSPTDDELAEEYRNADLLVCASRHEGWGLPALEAMASGLPVVSTLHEGCIAYSKPDANMVGVPTCNPDALAQGIRRGLEDQGLRERLIAGGLETAKRFTWREAGIRFVELLSGTFTQQERVFNSCA